MTRPAQYRLGQAVAKMGNSPHREADSQSTLPASSTQADCAKPGSLLNLGTGAAQGSVAGLLGKRIVSIVSLDNVHRGSDILALAQRDVLALNETLQESAALLPTPDMHCLRAKMWQSVLLRPQARSTVLQYMPLVYVQREGKIGEAFG